MNASNSYGVKPDFLSANIVEGSEMGRRRSIRQSLKAKFDKECVFNVNGNPELSSQVSRSSCSNWCDALAMSMSNVNAKQAWKTGTEKLSQTLNNVRTTFGTISQKIKKSTKRRQPLVNLDSPKTPMTPCTRSRALLGRTPTKLYSPFNIDTPTGKENVTTRNHIKKRSPVCGKGTLKSVRRRIKQKIMDIPEGKNNPIPFKSDTELSCEVLQTQIGIYEFHSVANQIASTGSRK